MKLGGKEIHGACADCGEILNCELCRQGQGVGRPKSNIAQMIRCQMQHRRQREDDSKQC